MADGAQLRDWELVQWLFAVLAQRCSGRDLQWLLCCAGELCWCWTTHTPCLSLSQPLPLQHTPDSDKPRLIKRNAEKVPVSEDGQTDGCWKQSFCDPDSSHQEEQATIRVAKHELKGDSNPACIARKLCQLSNLFSLSGSLLIKCPKYHQNPFFQD